jgi:hypothetical protein
LWSNNFMPIRYRIKYRMSLSHMPRCVALKLCFCVFFPSSFAKLIQHLKNVILFIQIKLWFGKKKESQTAQEQTQKMVIVIMIFHQWYVYLFCVWVNTCAHAPLRTIKYVSCIYDIYIINVIVFCYMRRHVTFHSL